MSKRNGNHPNNKGENWPKFLKEMQALAPTLKTLSTPGNRIQARALGKNNVEQYIDEKIEDLAEVERFRNHTVNTWFDQEIQKLAPRTFAHAKRTGKLWLFKLMGYSMQVAETYDTVEGVSMPCTVALIHRFGRLKVGMRFIWGQEKPKRKSRIVKP